MPKGNPPSVGVRGRARACLLAVHSAAERGEPAVQGGVCEGCGREAEALSPWRRYDRGARGRAPEGRTTELRLCPECHAALAAEEEAAAKRSRRATLILAAVAAVVGLVSLAGPPFWPVIVGWLAGGASREAAQEREAATPMSPYKPPDLVPLNQSTPQGQ
jgi:predicted Fe-S protein YdhL (DUF1289 family)